MSHAPASRRSSSWFPAAFVAGLIALTPLPARALERAAIGDAADGVVTDLLSGAGKGSLDKAVSKLESQLIADEAKVVAYLQQVIAKGS